VSAAHLAVVSLAFAAALGAAACGGNDKRALFPSGCTNPTYKPRQIIVTCADANTVLRGIAWTSYGEKTAAGKGTANVNTCDPNCASATFRPYPASVALSAPKDCTKSTAQFTHLVMTYTGARPPSGGSSIQEDFPCHGP
jgi:hypothetical protein